jgi:hypothetical protein
MVVSIDGEECTHLKTEGGTLGDLLKTVKNVLADQGRMVVGIVCDGNLLAPDVIESFLQQSMETFTRVDFQTSKPDLLAKNSLEACREYIAEITDRIDDVVEKFQKTSVQEAVSELGPIFARLNETYRGLQGIFQLMKTDPQGIELSTGSAEKAMIGVVSLLKEIKKALENHDYVQLGDLLQYELRPTVLQWNQIIDNLSELLNRENKE